MKFQYEVAFDAGFVTDEPILDAAEALERARKLREENPESDLTVAVHVHVRDES